MKMKKKERKKKAIKNFLSRISHGMQQKIVSLKNLVSSEML